MRVMSNENRNDAAPEQAATAEPKRLSGSGEGSEVLQIRLTKRSGRNIQEMSSITGIKNKTQLANAAIDLAADVMKTIHEGGIVTYENPDGTKVQLKVVGIG
jgi:hypothetical protein